MKTAETSIECQERIQIFDLDLLIDKCSNIMKSTTVEVASKRVEALCLMRQTRALESIEKHLAAIVDCLKKSHS